MAGREKAAKRKSRVVRGGPLAKILLVLLLLSVGWQLYSLRGQVAEAQAEKDRLTAQVEAKRRENAALSADIAEGGTQEKMEEIARDELGMVFPGEYVLCDGVN